MGVYFENTGIQLCRLRVQQRAPNGLGARSQRRGEVTPGGSVSVLAGVVNCRAKIWHYIPRRCGDAASDAYRGISCRCEAEPLMRPHVANLVIGLGGARRKSCHQIGVHVARRAEILPLD